MIRVIWSLFISTDFNISSKYKNIKALEYKTVEVASWYQITDIDSGPRKSFMIEIRRRSLTVSANGHSNAN